MKRSILSIVVLGFIAAASSVVFAGTNIVHITSQLDDHCVVFINGGPKKADLAPHGDTGDIFVPGSVLTTTEIKISCDDGHVFTNAIEDPFKRCDCNVSEGGPGLTCNCSN